MAERKVYATLGDIAAELSAMKLDGMTREAIIYALDRVFWKTES